MASFTDVRRHPERSIQDIEAAYSILDQSLLVYVAFFEDGTVFNIPMPLLELKIIYTFIHQNREDFTMP